MGAGLTISSITVGAFQENTYLVVDPSTNRAVLIDPGDEPQRVLSFVRASGAELEAVWLTHAHIDHVGALAAVKREWDVPVHLHPADLPLLAAAPDVAAAYGMGFEVPPPPSHALEDGQRLRVGALELEVMHTPGHAPGLVVFHGQGVVLAGDLLFAGSIGRTDMPFCDPGAMRRSLEKVMQLDDALVVHPGHGSATTIGAERATNPFLNGSARVIAR